MFNKQIPPNILAVTAANSTQNSYATYQSRTVGALLGDEFSVAWMEGKFQTFFQYVNKKPVIFILVKILTREVT